MHYIPIIDPGVSGNEPRGTYPPYDMGAEINVFVRNSSDQPFVGRVWNPVNTVWPDFTHPRAAEYWGALFKGLYLNDVYIERGRELKNLYFLA